MMEKKHNREELAERILTLIRENPGIRPRELHRILGIEHSGTIRNALIKQGVVRKIRKGTAVHYYALS